MPETRSRLVAHLVEDRWIRVAPPATPAPVGAILLGHTSVQAGHLTRPRIVIRFTSTFMRVALSRHKSLLWTLSPRDTPGHVLGSPDPDRLDGDLILWIWLPAPNTPLWPESRK